MKFFILFWQGNIIFSFLVKKNERNASWLSARFGKSRDHSLRLCALIQSMKMVAAICHEVFLEDLGSVDGFANRRFFDAAVKKKLMNYFFHHQTPKEVHQLLLK